MTFGDRLREARNKRGLTQLQLAEKAGITKEMISVYERDLGYPQALTLLYIADALEVSTDYLLGRDKYDTGRTRKSNFRI